MKRTILLLLTLSLILGVLSSCGHKTVDPIDDQTSSSPSEDTSAANTTEETNETNQSENTDTDDRLTEITTETENVYPTEYNYTVEKRGDKYYMVFDSYDIDPPGITYFGDTGILTTLYKLKNEIPNGILNDSDKRFLLHYFVSDTVRTDGFKLYDIEHIWKPIVPAGWVLQEDVSWHQNAYWFMATLGDTDTDEFLEATITVCSKEAYDSFCASIDPQSAQSLQNGDVVYTVSERASSDGFYGYRIACSNGEFFSYIQVVGYRKLTNDEILAFGVEEYLG